MIFTCIYMFIFSVPDDGTLKSPETRRTFAQYF